MGNGNNETDVGGRRKSSKVHSQFVSAFVVAGVICHSKFKLHEFNTMLVEGSQFLQIGPDPFRFCSDSQYQAHFRLSFGIGVETL